MVIMSLPVVVLASLTILLYGCSQGLGQSIRIPLYGLTSELTILGSKSSKYNETNYHTNVGLGSPRQIFKIQFDTLFSGDIWVPKSTWSLPWASYLHYSKGFDCSKSASCQRTEDRFKFQYRQATFKSEEILDSLILPAMSRQLEQMNFQVISDSNQDLGAWQPDGCIGLSPSLKTPTSGSPSLLARLVRDGQVDEAKFGLTIDEQLETGLLTLGSYQDPQLFDERLAIWHRAIGSGHLWRFTLEAVAIGNSLLGCKPDEECSVLMDSGSTLVRGPRQQVQMIYEILGAQLVDGLAYVDCKLASVDKHRISFNIDNELYEMLPGNYLKQTGDQNRCMVGIVANGASNETSGWLSPRDWVLGTNFMSAYYASFNLDRQTMALSKLRK